MDALDKIAEIMLEDITDLEKLDKIDIILEEEGY